MGHIPKLTPRQHAFLVKLVELCQEHSGPVHYSDLAARIGVSRFSAYDMLKVLEKKGMVSSSYAFAAGHSGPGRSMVVFTPTAEATAILAPSLDIPRLGENWPKVRERVLNGLRQARQANHREALNELLSHLPEAKAPLDFCAQMIGALLLNMQRAKARAGGLNPFRALAAFRANDDSGLQTLAGLSVGATLSADDEASSSLTRRLLEHARRYQTALSDLSTEAREALAQFLEEALEALD
jgi:DNA-binding MarR family transcriptional regulator